jgi:chromosome segregation ATPase
VGRTNPTYRDRLNALEREWQPYRRALRASEQAAFDRLFEHARAYAHAAGQRNHTAPEIPLLVSVLLAHERRLADLDGRLDALDEHLDTLDEHLDALDDRLGELERRVSESIPDEDDVVHD